MRYIPGEAPPQRNPQSERQIRDENLENLRRYRREQPLRRRAAADANGYNSDDERGSGQQGYENELEFTNALWRDRRWQVVKMQEDGACLFRAIAFHLYGDQDMHGQVRRLCMDYMVQNRDHFSEFITEDFNAYIQRKRNEREHGNHLEIQAVSELFNRRVEVYHLSTEPLNIFQPHSTSDEPIRLLYSYNHYDAIFDPNRPSFGVGLGFADFHPGEAERRLLADAEEASLGQAVIDSCIQQSDYERTEAEIEAAIVALSRAEYESAILAQIAEDSASGWS